MCRVLLKSCGAAVGGFGRPWGTFLEGSGPVGSGGVASRFSAKIGARFLPDLSALVLARRAGRMGRSGTWQSSRRSVSRASASLLSILAFLSARISFSFLSGGQKLSIFVCDMPGDQRARTRLRHHARSFVPLNIYSAPENSQKECSTAWAPTPRFSSVILLRLSFLYVRLVTVQVCVTKLHALRTRRR